ncbi:HAMP domain-containing sensor histidine kinase [Telmatospirillum sp.]|uniref:sensor histidine kinase n=1 Tax=Telmatospirillum sp. TaxID=2079197 RepID=UPI002850D3DC|nr:HAMP domain-containing sensor histidine kinase [Telmatospirillum sp.]MDR3437274.1 HAMP domain-containing sensor histidine kinase [Telmatospirillum sp.]
MALPIILYGQFERADRQTRSLVAENFRHHDWLVAQALSSLLEHTEVSSAQDLNAALEKFSENGSILKLMFRPKLKTGNPGFFFIASAPAVSAQQTGHDLDILAQHGILKSLADSCSWDKPVEIRYRQVNGTEEILTSIIPINNRLGCWALVSANNSSSILSTAFGRPYWQTDNVRMAALIYLIFAILAGLIAIRVRSALRHFRRVSHEIRRAGVGSAAFASRNILPELASAADDFDRLVRDLHHASSNIRRTAEENAHAVKAPLAIIRSALEPLKSAIPQSDQRSQRAVQLIDSALARLSTLISTAQRLGNDTADFIEAPKLHINLTDVVAECLRNARDISVSRNIRFVRHLAENVLLAAPDGILDIIVENILDNAISFSTDGSTITTTLSQSRGGIDLSIEDEGPGIAANKIDRIFDRNFSFRPGTKGDAAEPDHAGLGLWIVRHHIEALGGAVTAMNRAGGGLRIQVTLPGNGW